VSDPHFAAPFFAPRPARRGRSRPTCMSRSSGETRYAGDTVECAAGVAREIRADFIGKTTLVRFLPEAAFILVNAHSHRINA
jgi:hypothetical protein